MPILFAAFCLTIAALAARALPGLRPVYLWMMLTGLLAEGGALQNFQSFPPPLMLLLIPALAMTLVVCLARPTHQGLSMSGLIAFQAFRLPLEVIMHECSRREIMPAQMSFTGRNYDILSGLLALPLAWAVRRGKLGTKSICAWNTMGLVLLINVVATAVASLPGSTRLFWHEPVNTWITQFPYIWLPSLLVPLALAGHLLIFRKLARG